MSLVCMLRKWFITPPLGGRVAAISAFAAILIPTIIRWLVDDNVSGVVFSPYIPFLVLAAILLEWKAAAVVALASALVADVLFIEPRYQLRLGATDAFGVGIFLTTSMMVILLVRAARGIVQRVSLPAVTDELPTGIIFSLERGQAWASWNGSRTLLRLGPQAEVAEMMQDFLAQLELGKRLDVQNPGLVTSACRN